METNLLYRPIMLCLFLLSTLLLRAQTTATFPTSTPEQEGVSSTAILKMVERMENEIDAVHSIMILRHGKLISEGWWAPYAAESPHTLHSLSKSFTSTAIGMAIEDGKLSLDDQVISFFPALLPDSVSWQLRAMRIRDLLTMNTGHLKEPSLWSAKSDWVKAFLHAEVDFKPGTHFQYNSPATYMLSAILQNVTGEKLVDYLDERLFQVMDIKKPDWDVSPDGINTGGWGLHVTTEDIAKLGQLYLRKGMWQGQHILTEEWVQLATAKQTSNGSSPTSDWDQGYGFQFWRSRHNSYRGDGAFGQFCIVLPEYDAVVAITSGVSDMGAVMNVIWETLLPAMQPESLPADKDAHTALTQKLSALSLPALTGEMTSPIAKKLRRQSFRLAENPAGVQTVVFDLHKKDHRITLELEHGTEIIQIGQGTYHKAQMNHTLPYADRQRPQIASSGAWVKPDEYQLKIYFSESPASIVYTFHFADEKLSWKSELRHTLRGPELAILEGVEE